MEAEMSAKCDLTRGNIVGKLLRVAVPIMGMQLMQMAYNLADIFWMGKLSIGSVAASSTSGMFIWMAFGMMLFGRVGAEIGVSQNLGSGKPEVALKYSQNALALGAVLGIVYSVLLIALRYPLIGFFGLEERVADDARMYLLIVAAGLPLDFLFNVLVGTYNASGNSRMPFYAGAVGLVVNMILDPVLIFGMGMGIRGAAISNVVGQVLSCVMMLIAIRRGSKRPFAKYAFFIKPDFAYIKQILRWSVPNGLESMFFTAMTMIVVRFVAGFGSTAVAVGKVGSQFESLSWLLGGGFASALTAFMGQNYGAEKWTRIRSGYRIAMQVMLCWGSAITLALWFLGRYFFGIFLPGEAEAIGLGVTYCQILAVCQIPQCFEAISGSVFKGAGQTLPSFIVSATCNLLRMVLAYFLSKTALGVYGVWIAISIGAIARGIWMFVWCRLMLRTKPKNDIDPCTAAVS